MCVDKCGALCDGESYSNPAHAEISKLTNKNKLRGALADVIRGADVFLGVSAPKIVTGEMIKSMTKDPIVFPLANPVPE